MDKQLKKGIVRLTINVDKNNAEGDYNQFFKLFDLWSPAFSYKVRINQDLVIVYERKERGKEVNLTMILKEEAAIINIYDCTDLSKDSIFCYGNLYTINRFCVLTLFNYLNKSNNTLFENNFINYLSSCEENEIKKILTIIGQTLTVFSEYNFNSSLQLTHNLIKEIHYVDENITYQITDFSKDDYDQKLTNLILHSKHAEDIKKTKEFLFDNLDSTDEFTISLYGNKIKTKNHFVEFKDQDFSDYSSELFSKNDYIETRPAEVESKKTIFEAFQEVGRLNNLRM